ncbi:piggyBac transposable element-derived protein 4 [Lates japonicus]|uniref:PiggyBac transposable element-derived protein 4 n=1 Tax=Lates japonicus TaxID=270547 RepID=A0AAD3R547_LATJO|nr:piggyBac transposable element-derived protein 4 [Lates japonicus]
METHVEKKKYNVTRVLDIIFDDEDQEDGDNGDSEPDGWSTDEYEENLDPIEDENFDETAPLSSTPPSTPSSPPSTPTTPKATPGRRGRWPGRRRRQGCLPSQAETEEGRGLNNVEEGDTLHRFPNFCPKRTRGLQTLIGKDDPPVSIFKLFFDLKDVTTICQDTNHNAAKGIAKGRKFKWAELKPTEFFQFAGLLFYMAILKLPRLVDYWTQRSIFSVSFPRSVMARDRFLAIARNVHMSDPNKDIVNDKTKSTHDPDCDPLHRLKPLYDNIRDTCKALCQPRKKISIDEHITQYYCVHRKTNKRYGTQLYHFMDIAATNSYILYSEQCSTANKKPMSHQEFMEELAAGLCGVSQDWPTPNRGADCLPVCLNTSVADEEGPEGTPMGRGRSAGTASKGRRRCANCGKCASWKCRHCDVVLCLVVHRNCFTDWHNKKGAEVMEPSAEP